MRILFISNFGTTRCGVAEYGRWVASALEAEGAQVTRWDGSYPVIYSMLQQGLRGYVPEDAESYDVIHLNWHPGTINHYVPAVLPPGVPFSVFLHDIPPWSYCPVLEIAHARFTLEPFDGCTVIPPIVPDVVEGPELIRLPRVLIGRTGIGVPGKDEIAEVCRLNGWEFSNSIDWLPIQAEVARLARCTANVCWYHSGQSKSAAVMVAAAARRPLVLNNSPRFSHLVPYWDEVYFTNDLEGTLKKHVVGNPDAVIPKRILEDFSVRRAARRMLEIWSHL